MNVSDIDPIPPYGGEDYEKFYGNVDYSNKVVLDIGADYGSTAYWFILKGASSVIAIDADSGYYQRMVNSFSKTDRVKPFNITIKSGECLREIIERYKPQILKMDCEGCESALLSLHDDLLKIPETYVLEVHDDSTYNLIKKLLENLGYILTREWNWTKGVWMSSWDKRGYHNSTDKFTGGPKSCQKTLSL